MKFNRFILEAVSILIVIALILTSFYILNHLGGWRF
jgi:hypothetical protein